VNAPQWGILETKAVAEHERPECDERSCTPEHDANATIKGLISSFNEVILVMGFSASRGESKAKLLFNHVVNGFTFAGLTTLINADVLVIIGRVFRDVLAEPFLKPGNWGYL
jgi:hypothetical protein